jgi:hypothetical protein
VISRCAEHFQPPVGKSVPSQKASEPVHVIGDNERNPARVSLQPVPPQEPLIGRSLLIYALRLGGRALAQPSAPKFSLKYIRNDLPPGGSVRTDELPENIGHMFYSFAESDYFRQKRAVVSWSLRIQQNEQGDFFSLLYKFLGHLYCYNPGHTITYYIIGASRLEGAKIG